MRIVRGVRGNLTGVLSRAESSLWCLSDGSEAHEVRLAKREQMLDAIEKRGAATGEIYASVRHGGALLDAIAHDSTVDYRG